MQGQWRLAVLIGYLSCLAAVHGVTLEYALAQPPCRAYIAHLEDQNAASPQPTSDTAGVAPSAEPFGTAIDLQLTNLDISEVAVPWQLELYNSGYLRLIGAAGLDILPTEQKGCVVS